jgi:hypothetical protein
MAVRSYLDQQIQNEAAARAAGAPVTPGSFTDIASREVNPQFVQRALGNIPSDTQPAPPAYQQTLLSGLLGQLQNATPEQQQQVARFAPQLQGLLGRGFQDSEGYDPDTPKGPHEELPVGWDSGIDPVFWTNEMLNARIKQLEQPIAYAKQSSFTKPLAMNAWDWITRAFGMETDEEESNRHKKTLEGNLAFDMAGAAAQRSDEQRQQVMAGGGAAATPAAIRATPVLDEPDLPDAFAESGYALGPGDPQW